MNLGNPVANVKFVGAVMNFAFSPHDARPGQLAHYSCGVPPRARMRINNQAKEHFFRARNGPIYWHLARLWSLSARFCAAFSGAAAFFPFRHPRWVALTEFGHCSASVAWRLRRRSPGRRSALFLLRVAGVLVGNVGPFRSTPLSGLQKSVNRRSKMGAEICLLDTHRTVAQRNADRARRLALRAPRFRTHSRAGPRSPESNVPLDGPPGQ